MSRTMLGSRLLPPHHHISKILLNLRTAPGNTTHTEQQGMSCYSEGSSWDLQPESWHHLGSILSPCPHQPQESCKETNHEPYEPRTPTGEGHTPLTGVIPGPPKWYQKVNTQWPPRRLRKKIGHTSKQLQLNCPKHIILCSADLQTQLSHACFQSCFRGKCFFTGIKLGSTDINQRCKGAQPDQQKVAGHEGDKGELLSSSTKHFTQL